MYYHKKLLFLILTISPLFAICANYRNSDDRRAAMDQKHDEMLKRNLDFMNKNQDPHSLMYQRLEADIRATREYMPEYLRLHYETNLNEYNHNRLLEYNRLFNNLEEEYNQIRNGTLTISDEFSKIKDLMQRRRLTTNETSNHLMQLHFLIENLEKKIKSLQEITKESQILAENWENRSSEKAIEHHGKLFDPINCFPVQKIKISNDMESYSLIFLDAYFAGINVFTRSNNQGETTEKDKALLAFIENIFKVKEESDHEKRIQELITRFWETNTLIVKNLASQKNEIIKKSIANNMPDSFERYTDEHESKKESFDLKKEIIELTNKTNEAEKRLASYLQEIKDVASIARNNIGQDLQKMIEAKSTKFIQALNQKRELDLKVSTELDKKAQEIILERGAQIKNSLKKENISNIEDAYSSLSEVFQKDALLSEKYLKNTLYQHKKDFLFNDKDFLTSYPINSWSIFIRQIFSETLPQ